MGSLCFKGKNPPKSKPLAEEEFSWEKRKAALDPKDFVVQGLEGETVLRPPGTVDGQQFRIEDCKNCDIFLCDWCDSVQVDACQDCRLVLGPASGSVFLRDSKQCTVITACRQLRLRDCHRLNVFTFCSTHPSLEASRNIHLGCFDYFYPGLKDHMNRAGLDVFANTWWDVFDFNAAEGNWDLLPTSRSSSSALLHTLPDSDLANQLNATPTNQRRVVPVTHGPQTTTAHEVALVLLALPKADDFWLLLDALEQEDSTINLTRTRTVDHQQVQAQLDGALSGPKGHVSGLMVALEFCGDKAFSVVTRVVNALNESAEKGPMFLTTSSAESATNASDTLLRGGNS